jgi:hypothetical protein
LIQYNTTMSGTNAIIEGNLNVVISPDVDNGAGSIFAEGALDVDGAATLDQTSINTTDGQFLVTGSNKINFNPTAAVEIQAAASSFFNTSTGNLSLATTGGNIVVNSSAILDIDASTSVLVDSLGAISLDAQSTSNFTVTGAFPMTVSSSAGSVVLNSGKASTDAIALTCANAAGGVTVSPGTGGLDVNSTGKIALDASAESSNFTLTTTANGQDLTVSVAGGTDSSLMLISDGTNADALRLQSSNVAGGIDIDSGTGGILADTTGGISLDAAAASNLTTSAGNLTLSATAGQSSLLAGSATADAIRIFASDAAGGIDIDSGTGGILADTTGSISLDAAAASNLTTSVGNLTLKSNAGRSIVEGGLAAANAVSLTSTNVAGGATISTGTAGLVGTSTGPLSLAHIGASNITVNTTNPADDFTLAVTGTTDSSLVLSSTGTSVTDAILMTTSVGGISVSANQELRLDSADVTDGVKIATQTAGVPVVIGTASSTTTIPGNLIVSGATTTIDTATLTVEDNILLLNSGPLGTADGGVAIKRFQSANNAAQGDIVADVPKVTGQTAQAGSATTITLANAASAVDSFYNGWWIRITGGASTGRVRRIKSYVGATRVATIYDTADHTALPEIPQEGLDFSPVPDNTSVYNLYNTTYIASFWDESADEYVLAYTTLSPASQGQVIISDYLKLKVGNLAVTGTLNVNTINEFTFDSGVTIEGVLINNGLINGAAPDIVITVVLPRILTTPVSVPSIGANGSYIVLVSDADAPTTGAHAVFMLAGNNTNQTVNRLVSTTATGGGRLNMTWGDGASPFLQHSPAYGSGSGNINYTVKIIRTS